MEGERRPRKYEHYEWTSQQDDLLVHYATISRYTAKSGKVRVKKLSRHFPGISSGRISDRLYRLRLAGKLPKLSTVNKREYHKRTSVEQAEVGYKPRGKYITVKQRKMDLDRAAQRSVDTLLLSSLVIGICILLASMILVTVGR